MKQTPEYLALLDAALKEDIGGLIGEDEFTVQDFVRDLSEDRRISDKAARAILASKVKDGVLSCRKASNYNGGSVMAYKIIK